MHRQASIFLNQAPMNADFQSIAALAIVAITATWMIVRAVQKRGKPGCGGDCACPTQELKR
jgi:hypothetical protein